MCDGVMPQISPQKPGEVGVVSCRAGPLGLFVLEVPRFGSSVFKSVSLPERDRCSRRTVADTVATTCLDGLVGSGRQADLGSVKPIGCIPSFPMPRQLEELLISRL